MTLHPSSVLWTEKGIGKIVDNDNIGGPLSLSSADQWCATAVSGGYLEVWHAELAHGQHAVALLNRSPKRETIVAKWELLGIEVNQMMTVWDVWNEKLLGQLKVQVSAAAPAYGVVLLTLSPAPHDESDFRFV